MPDFVLDGTSATVDIGQGYSLRAPGMTVVTPGWSTIHLSASCAAVAPEGASFATSWAARKPTSYGTPLNVSPTSNSSPTS